MASTSVFVYDVSPDVDLDDLAQHLDSLVTPNGIGSRKSSPTPTSRGNECIVSFNYDIPVELQNNTLDFRGQELHAFALPTEIIETVVVRLRKEWTDILQHGELFGTSNKSGIRVDTANGIVELHGEMNRVIDVVRDIQRSVIDALAGAHTRMTGPKEQRKNELNKVLHDHSACSIKTPQRHSTGQPNPVDEDTSKGEALKHNNTAAAHSSGVTRDNSAAGTASLLNDKLAPSSQEHEGLNVNTTYMHAVNEQKHALTEHASDVNAEGGVPHASELDDDKAHSKPGDQEAGAITTSSDSANDGHITTTHIAGASHETVEANDCHVNETASAANTKAKISHNDERTYSGVIVLESTGPPFQGSVHDHESSVRDERSSSPNHSLGHRNRGDDYYPLAGHETDLAQGKNGEMKTETRRPCQAKGGTVRTNNVASESTGIGRALSSTTVRDDVVVDTPTNNADSLKDRGERHSVQRSFEAREQTGKTSADRDKSESPKKNVERALHTDDRQKADDGHPSITSKSCALSNQCSSRTSEYCEVSRSDRVSSSSPDKQGNTAAGANRANANDRSANSSRVMNQSHRESTVTNLRNDTRASSSNVGRQLSSSRTENSTTEQHTRTPQHAHIESHKECIGVKQVKPSSRHQNTQNDKAISDQSCLVLANESAKVTVLKPGNPSILEPALQRAMLRNLQELSGQRHHEGLRRQGICEDIAEENATWQIKEPVWVYVISKAETPWSKLLKVVYVDARKEMVELQGNPADIEKLKKYIEVERLDRTVAKQMFRLPAGAQQNTFEQFLRQNAKDKIVVRWINDSGNCEVIGKGLDLHELLKLFEDQCPKHGTEESRIMQSTETNSTASKMIPQQSVPSSTRSMPTVDNKLEVTTPKSKIKVTIETGDILRQRCEVLVSPCNHAVDLSQGLAKLIAAAAGKCLVRECQEYVRKYGSLGVTEVMDTQAGSLPSPVRRVIHAHGPHLCDYVDIERCCSDLERTFLNCLVCASKLRAVSVALPAISSDNGGVPYEIVGTAACYALIQFDEVLSQRPSSQRCMKEIKFVNVKPNVTLSMVAIFKELLAVSAPVCQDNYSGKASGRKSTNDSSRPQIGATHLPSRPNSKEKSDSQTDNTSSASCPNNSASSSVSPDADDNSCPICMDGVKKPERLSCGHVFCADCIERSLKYQNKCPCCGKLFGEMKGDRLRGGKMEEKREMQELEGYRGCGRIVVTYSIPDGQQQAHHPNPGRQYKGAYRTAYLPDNAEGREICSLLRRAFDAGLIFTVGRSTTSGQEDVVTWNDIHHKTNPTGP